MISCTTMTNISYGPQVAWKSMDHLNSQRASILFPLHYLIALEARRRDRAMGQSPHPPGEARMPISTPTECRQGSTHAHLHTHWMPSQPPPLAHAVCEACPIQILQPEFCRWTCQHLHHRGTFIFWLIFYFQGFTLTVHLPQRENTYV